MNPAGQLLQHRRIEASADVLACPRACEDNIEITFRRNILNKSAELLAQALHLLYRLLPYFRLLSDFLEGVFADRETANKVNLRFGVFADAQREPDIGERFARAGEAADSVKDDPERLCGFI